MEKTVVVDGIAYHTLFEGSHDAPTVLLVHALMSNLHMWDHTVPALHAAGYSTLRFDHVGHHRTPAPSTDSTQSIHMDDITRHMHALVSSLPGREGPSPPPLAAVVGCSIGGVLALRFAMLYPTAVAKAVSITAPGIRVPDAVRPLWAARIAQFEADVRAGADVLCRATVDRWFPGARPRDDPARAAALAHVRTCTLPGYRLLADAIRDYDYADAATHIRDVQCLIVAGEDDHASSSQSLEQLAAQIDGADFVEMKAVGHLPPMQHADEFNRIVVAFLGR